MRLAAAEPGRARRQVQFCDAGFLDRTDEPPAPAAVMRHRGDERDGVVHELSVGHISEPER